MVNFWATWCGHCKQEMPHLSRLYDDQSRASGFTLLGVNVDEDAKQAAATAGKWGVGFPVLFDGTKSVSKLYDLQSMPSHRADRPRRPRHLHRGYRDGLEESYERSADPRAGEGMNPRRPCSPRSRRWPRGERLRHRTLGQRPYESASAWPTRSCSSGTATRSRRATWSTSTWCAKARAPTAFRGRLRLHRLAAGAFQASGGLAAGGNDSRRPRAPSLPGTAPRR